MSKISFATLLIIYQNAIFGERGEEDSIHISTPEICHALQLIENDQSGDSSITVICDDEFPTFKVGETYELNIAQPRIGLGCLARTFAEFLNFPKAHFSEPNNYFILDGKISKLHKKGRDERIGSHLLIDKYLDVIKIIDIFSEAAAYLDVQKEELVFFKDRKLSIPILYTEKDLEQLNKKESEKFISYFRDDLHKDEKISILSASLFRMADSQTKNKRFAFLLHNIDNINSEIKIGYNIYVSSFSYEKIRSEIDSARLDYIGKIQKTLTDIQTQLLGIPISTILVASQFKEVKKCGSDFWTNSVVVIGCWIFIVVLWLTLRNQRVSLLEIKKEIERQENKLKEDYKDIISNFSNSFDDLFKRIKRVKRVLCFILGISIFGASGATYVYFHITGVSYKTCAIFHIQSDNKK